MQRREYFEGATDGALLWRGSNYTKGQSCFLAKRHLMPVDESPMREVRGKLREACASCD